MSKYTTQLRFICESLHTNESTGYASVREVIQAAAPKIFDFPFPYWEESDRGRFEEMVLRHFYTREIGYETYGLWKLKLEDKLNVIMPYYNQLYLSTKLDFDPLTDYNESRSGKRKTDNTTESSSNTNGRYDSESTSEVLTKHLDTPQNGVTDLLNDKYLTDASTSEGNSTGGGTNVSNTSGNTTLDGSEVYEETIKGKRGSSSYAKLLEEYRRALLNVDQMVLVELEELFMGIW